MANSTKLKELSVYEGQNKLYNFIQQVIKLRSYEFDKHEHRIEPMTPRQEVEYTQFLEGNTLYMNSVIKNTGRFKIYRGSTQIQ